MLLLCGSSPSPGKERTLAQQSPTCVPQAVGLKDQKRMGTQAKASDEPDAQLRFNRAFAKNA